MQALDNMSTAIETVADLANRVFPSRDLFELAGETDWAVFRRMSDGTPDNAANMLDDEEITVELALIYMGKNDDPERVCDEKVALIEKAILVDDTRGGLALWTKLVGWTVPREELVPDARHHTLLTVLIKTRRKYGDAFVQS